MGEFVGFVMVLGMFFTVLTAGFGMAQAQGVQSDVARIANTAIQEMQVAGGYTYSVQSGVLAALQADGLNPSDAQVTITYPPSPPGSGAAPVPYGAPMEFNIIYTVPLNVVGLTALTVPVGDGVIGVSTCPWVPPGSPPAQCNGSSGGGFLSPLPDGTNP